MKQLLILFFTWHILGISAILSQSSCYKQLKNEGITLYEHKYYERAINKYLAALNCDSIDQNELASLIKQAQHARQNELIRERNTARANALTAQSILALKQERNPSKACHLANNAIKIVPNSLTAWGAYLDAWYSQVFLWKGRYYTVPMAEIYRQTGILGSAILSPDGRIFATASWDPPIVNLWSLLGEETISLLGFSDPVWRMRFSPDGRQLAVASLDGTVRIYSSEGQTLFRLTDHKGPVYEIKFSSDGRYLLSASQDSSAIVWDVNTGKAILRLTNATPGAVKVAAFSPDNTRIITADENGKAAVWDFHGKKLFDLYHGMLPITEAFFTSDGQRVITAGEEGNVKIWGENGQIMAENKQQSRVDAMALSPDASKLVIGSRDGKITISNLSEKTIRNFQAHSDAVNGIVFSPDSTHFLTFSSDNTIKIWTVVGKLILTLGEFTGPVLAAGFSADGNTVYGSSWDGSARLFHLTGHPIDTYPGLGGNVQRVIIAPGGEKILAVSLNGRAMVWQLNNGDSIQCAPNAGWLHDASFAPKEEQALITSDSGIILWDLRQSTWKRLAHTGASAARFFPNGTILTGSTDGSLKCWTASGELLMDLGKGPREICVLDISRDGQLIATGHQNGFVTFWSVSKRAALWQHQYHTGEKVYSVAFSPSGQMLLSAGGDNRAFLWNRKGEPVNVYKHAGPVTNAAFSPDGAWVLSHSVDGTAKLWEKDKDTASVILRMPTAINCALLSPNGRFIATASNDGIIRLWDLEGALLASLPASDRAINWIALSPKSDLLISCSSDGRIHSWDLDTTRLSKTLPSVKE